MFVRRKARVIGVLISGFLPDRRPAVRDGMRRRQERAAGRADDRAFRAEFTCVPEQSAELDDKLWTGLCGHPSAPSNFAPCRGGPFALCYYSGPSLGSEVLSCKLTPDGKYANCQCFDIPYGVYFVDINAILNDSVYKARLPNAGWTAAARELKVKRKVREAIFSSPQKSESSPRSSGDSP